MFSFCARIRRFDKQITPQLNEVKPSARAVHRHQNERVHSNVHQAVIQYVQFTFAENMNEFMNYRSMNAFRHNTGGDIREKRVIWYVVNVMNIKQ